MASRNTVAMVLAIIAGILLVVSGIDGLGMWELIKEFVTTYIIDHIAVQLIFAAIIFIASLGGVAVMGGGLLVGKGRLTTGKFLIMIGTGMGIIGLVAAIAVDYESGNFSIAKYYSLGTIGIILSIVARMVAGKSEPHRPKMGTAAESEEEPEVDE
jgi:hypothetical protein